MADSTVAMLTLGVVIVLFVVNRLPVGVVAVGAALSLWATGLLELDETLGGFGDPVVVFIATLFIVSEAIDATGLTTWAGQRVVALAGDTPARLLVAVMALCAVLTALISLNGSVAALLPMVVLLAVRLGQPPSRMLMPMVYAGSAGSLLVLMGSPVNVIVSDAARDAGEGAFGFFDFAIVGIPILVATVLVGVVLSPRLLPDRQPITAPSDLSRHADVLGQQYQVDPGDDGSDPLIDRDHGVAEAVVPPRSPLVGEIVQLGVNRPSGLTILAVQRYGKNRTGSEAEVLVGDCLLISGPWSALNELIDDREILLVDNPDRMRRQAIPLGRRSSLAIAIVVVMVVLLATGAVPAAVAGLIAVLALVLTRVVTSAQAYRAVSWETIVLIGGLIPLADAIQRSGAADKIADAILAVVGESSPVILMLAIFVVTVILGLVISNTATVLIVLPIALSAAEETGVSVRPILMLVAVAGSAALLTPIQTPGNMMIMSPGGYRFSDYCRLGLPLLAIWLVISLAVIPLAWAF